MQTASHQGLVLKLKPVFQLLSLASVTRLTHNVKNVDKAADRAAFQISHHPPVIRPTATRS